MSLSQKALSRLKIMMGGDPQYDSVAKELQAGLVAVAVDPGNIATADASDLATAITLANATKAKVNALMAAMRAAGMLA